MEIVAIMATIILIATLATLIFAFAAYFITKAKKKKTSAISNIKVEEKPVRTYFERYIPHSKSAISQNTISFKEHDDNQWM